MAFNFGTPKTASGFTLPTSTATPPTSATGGAGDSKPTTKPLLGAPTPSFSFSASPKTTTPSLNFNLGASTPSFAFTGSTATPVTTTAPTAISTSVAAVTSFTPILGSSAATSTPATTTPFKLTTPFNAATSASTAVTAPLGLGLSAVTTTTAATTTTATSLSLGTPALVTSTAQAPVSTTAAAAPAVQSGLHYAQLEDSINKWTIDLEEQGKFFINQAKQLNAWDNLLISNSEKIVTLNETIERIKEQQKQLDQELDFVLAQQNELDELSLPLEKQLADIPVTDQNRFQTYQLAEIIDSQLKQMSEDLKEIVEQLNESNKEEDISDPVIQISRILNAHMNSLQWIDRNTSQISTHLEQVTQLQDSYKKNTMNL